MTVIELIKQNYKQPKYMLPAILYIPLLFTGYTVCNLFATEKAEAADTRLETKYELNDKIQDAHIKGDGLGNKYDSMLESYGKIKDVSAVENVEKQEEQKEQYESKYTDAELAALEQQSREQENAVKQLHQLQENMRESQNRTEGIADNRVNGNTPEEAATLAELQQALSNARGHANSLTSTQHEDQLQEKYPSTPKHNTHAAVEEKPKNPKAVNEIPEEAETEEVVIKTSEPSDYFNSIGTNENRHKLIKAIIDEDIKAVEGSRLRLRLLDDIEVGQTTIPKGSYLYATMSNFANQRVKGTVKSVFMNDDLIKINLSIYDTDGLEGLYVPESTFRETAKDIGSQTMNTPPNFNTGTTIESAFVQWGMNAVQQGVQKTSQAISKNLKKNRVKLKYGTVVYLINSKERKNQNAGSFDPNKVGTADNPIASRFQNIYNNNR